VQQRVLRCAQDDKFCGIGSENKSNGGSFAALRMTNFVELGRKTRATAGPSLRSG